MSYNTMEISAHLGSPLELYQFAQGETVWRFTSRGRTVTEMGETWTASVIKRGAIRQARELNRNGVEVRIPIDNPLAVALIEGQPERVTSVTIWRRHATDPDAEWRVEWKGRLRGRAITGKVMTLTCESLMASTRRYGPYLAVTVNCRHVLYGAGCGLDPADFAVPATCTAVDGYTVTVAEAALQPDGWYTGGRFEFGGVQRFVGGHAGDQLTLFWPIPAVAAVLPAAVVIYPGCDRAKETCNNKFNNIAAQGAYPWLPDRDPWDGSVL